MAVKQYAAAGGVVIQDGSMLLLNRPTRGEIRLPKGHIDEGESAEEAALRETCEESGYGDLEIIADLGSLVVEFDYNDNHYVRTEYYFLMRLTGDRLVERSPKDAQQFQPIWVPLEEAVSRLTFAAERTFAQRGIAAHGNGQHSDTGM
ncbi:MAG: NUDIX domain-containing protein [Caldilineaceae bacterium]|nr:NUDIX domain-containing protein [Caldilineaceae bacterium]